MQQQQQKEPLQPQQQGGGGAMAVGSGQYPQHEQPSSLVPGGGGMGMDGLNFQQDSNPMAGQALGQQGQGSVAMPNYAMLAGLHHQQQLPQHVAGSAHDQIDNMIGVGAPGAQQQAQAALYWNAIQASNQGQQAQQRQQQQQQQQKEQHTMIGNSVGGMRQHQQAPPLMQMNANEVQEPQQEIQVQVQGGDSVRAQDNQTQLLLQQQNLIVQLQRQLQQQHGQQQQSGHPTMAQNQPWQEPGQGQQQQGGVLPEISSNPMQQQSKNAGSATTTKALIPPAIQGYMHCQNSSFGGNCSIGLHASLKNNACLQDQVQQQQQQLSSISGNTDNTAAMHQQPRNGTSQVNIQGVFRSSTSAANELGQVNGISLMRPLNPKIQANHNDPGSKSSAPPESTPAPPSNSSASPGSGGGTGPQNITNLSIIDAMRRVSSSVSSAQQISSNDPTKANSQQQNQQQQLLMSHVLQHQIGVGNTAMVGGNNPPDRVVEDAVGKQQQGQQPITAASILEQRVNQLQLMQHLQQLQSQKQQKAQVQLQTGDVYARAVGGHTVQIQQQAPGQQQNQQGHSNTSQQVGSPKHATNQMNATTPDRDGEDGEEGSGVPNLRPPQRRPSWRKSRTDSSFLAGVAPDPIADGVNNSTSAPRGGVAQAVRSGAGPGSSSGGGGSSKDGNQSFLDGHFAGGWQSNADLPDRRRIIFSIIKVIERMRPDANRLPLMAKKLEEHLYRSAHTREKYIDPASLKRRLHIIAKGVGISNTENGDDASMGGSIVCSVAGSAFINDCGRGGETASSPKGQPVPLEIVSQDPSSVSQCPVNAPTPTAGAVLPSHSLRQGEEEQRPQANLPQDQQQALQQKHQDLQLQYQQLLLSQPHKERQQQSEQLQQLQQQQMVQQVAQHQANMNTEQHHQHHQQPNSSDAQNPKNYPSVQNAESEKKKVILLQQQRRLLLLRHASKCQGGPSCRTKFCPQMVILWKHMKKCRDKHCMVPHCLSSRCVLNHYRMCKSEGKTASCQICAPVMRHIQQGGCDPLGNSASRSGSDATPGEGLDMLVLDGVDVDPLDSAFVAPVEGAVESCPVGGATPSFTPNLSPNPSNSSTQQAKQTTCAPQLSMHLLSSQGGQQPVNNDRQGLQQDLQTKQLLLQQVHQQKGKLIGQNQKLQQQLMTASNPHQAQQLQKQQEILQQLNQQCVQQQMILQSEIQQLMERIQQVQQQGMQHHVTHTNSQGMQGHVNQDQVQQHQGKWQQARQQVSQAQDNQAQDSHRQGNNQSQVQSHGNDKKQVQRKDNQQQQTHLPGNKQKQQSNQAVSPQSRRRVEAERANLLKRRLNNTSAKAKAKAKAKSQKKANGDDSLRAQKMRKGENGELSRREKDGCKKKGDASNDTKSKENGLPSDKTLSHESSNDGNCPSLPDMVTIPDSQSLSMSAQLVAQKCRPLIEKLIEHKHGWVFKDPVDPVELGIPEYFDVVDHPMDLTLVSNKLGGGAYPDVASFEHDTKLVFENAILFNGEDSDVGVMARELLKIFGEDINNAMKGECEKKCQFTVSSKKPHPSWCSN